MMMMMMVMTMAEERKDDRYWHMFFLPLATTRSYLLYSARPLPQI